MIRLLLFTAFWIWFGIKFHVPFWGGVFLYFLLLLYFLWLNEASKPCYVSEQDLKDFFDEAPAEEPSHHVEQPVEKEL